MALRSKGCNRGGEPAKIENSIGSTCGGLRSGTPSAIHCGRPCWNCRSATVARAEKDKGASSFAVHAEEASVLYPELDMKGSNL